MHPNILPFYGVCDLSTEELKRICIVSAWMDCGYLLNYLKETPNPPRYLLVRSIIQFSMSPLSKIFTHISQMLDIISGLAYIHGLDIIHSDLQAVAYNRVPSVCH
jgi:serine/threonine protein kinase